MRIGICKVLVITCGRIVHLWIPKKYLSGANWEDGHWSERIIVCKVASHGVFRDGNEVGLSTYGNTL